MEKRFSIVEALRFGFYTTIEHILFFLGILCTWAGIFIASILAVGLIFFVPYLYKIIPFLKNLYVQGVSTHDLTVALFSHGTPWVILAGLLTMFIIVKLVNAWLQLGFIRITLEFHDYQTARFTHLFSCAHLILKGFVVSFLYTLIVTVGMILLIVPGFIWAAQFGFCMQVLVDRNPGIMRCFKTSSAITNGSKLHLIGFFLVLALINFVAAKLWFIGLFISVPVSFLAMAYVYRKLLQLPVVA